MLNVKYSGFLNEDMALGFISNMKLRDAIHDIVVSLGPKQSIDVEELSKQLMDDYRITISPFFLDKFLDDYLKTTRGNKKVKSFLSDETQWLGVRDINGNKEIRNNLLYLKPSLSKHKRKLFVEDEKKMIDDAYKAGMKELNFTEDIIKKSIVLQHPDDSIDFMKIIYTDIIVSKKFENTYDNCWKMMMLIARSNKLDKVRGWFKLSPDSVKDEYKKKGRINLDLTKGKNVPVTNVKKLEPVTPIIKPKTNPSFPFYSLPYRTFILKQIENYKDWNDFKSRIGLDLLIYWINIFPSSVVVPYKHDIKYNVMDLNNTFMEKYKVGIKDIIVFYTKIGLGKYLRNAGIT